MISHGVGVLTVTVDSDGSVAASSRVCTKGLHLALGVVVHEPRVAGEVLGRRRGGGDVDGVGFLSGRHDVGCYEFVIGCVSWATM